MGAAKARDEGWLEMRGDRPWCRRCGIPAPKFTVAYPTKVRRVPFTEVLITRPTGETIATAECHGERIDWSSRRGVVVCEKA